MTPLAVTNFSKLLVEAAMAMLRPDVPATKRNRAPRIVRSCNGVGNPRKMNVVKRRGDM